MSLFLTFSPFRSRSLILAHLRTYSTYSRKSDRQGFLAGRTALVTGASKGIGQAIVRELVQQGASVAMVSRSVSRLQNAKHEIVQELSESENSADIASRMATLECDIANATEEELKELISRASAEIAALDAENSSAAFDILVNCAGINRDSLLIRTTEQDLRDIIDTNLIATMRVTKHMVGHMMRSRIHGNDPHRSKSIINIGSIVGNGAIGGNVGQCVYSASKAALVGFTKTLAKEVGSRNIRVNLVAPGFIETDMTEAHRQSESIASLLRSRIVLPNGRLGTPQEVAKVVSFLASENASYITGQVLNVDGGFSL